MKPAALALCSALAVLLALGHALQAQDANDAPGARVVHCHDTVRDIVQRKLANRCDGAIVTREEAAAIRGRRANAIRRALEPVPGRRLTGIGTGFFVAEAGQVLTNNHVVAGCAAISVTTSTGKTVTAALIGADEENDLAVLDANMAAPATASFRVTADRSGQEAITFVGYPNQGIPPIKPMLTTGVILHGPPTDEPIFRIYADVRRGNSGGPVIDKRGRVVGVIFAKIDTVKVYERTGSVIRHVGVAVKNDVVFEFLDRHAVAYSAYSHAAANPMLTDDQILDTARAYVARIGCWQ